MKIFEVYELWKYETFSTKFFSEAVKDKKRGFKSKLKCS